jgi:DNA-binding transcriptional MerR regulator
VARSALRYEELGLLRPIGRRSGQRRYDEAAVRVVGVILLLPRGGFSLKEIRQIMHVAPESLGSLPWWDIAVQHR